MCLDSLLYEQRTKVYVAGGEGVVKGAVLKICLSKLNLV